MYKRQEKALALLDAACRLDVLFHGENALFVLESSEPLHALKQEPRYAALLERLKAATGTKPDDAGRKAN